MARNIASRLLIEGTLETLTPLHVGGFGTSPDTDMPLARNGRDQLYIPGTSLAGVFRAWCERAFGEEIIKHLWGYQKGDKGNASFIIVGDIVLPSNIIVETRDGVGIDRAWGVAADGAKYDRAVVPRGVRMKLKMLVELSSSSANKTSQSGTEANNGRVDGNKAKAVIGHLLQALKAESLTIGAARTRGLGRVKLLDDPEIKEQKLDDFKSILNAIEGLSAKPNENLTIAKLIEAHTETKLQPRKQLTIKINWHPRSPLMVKAGYDGIGVDMLPLVSATGDGKLNLVLPGSSIKGSLRCHAERIIRTLLGFDSSNRKSKFHDQIDLPLIEYLFGSRSKSDTEKQAAKKTRPRSKATTDASRILPGRGALSIGDCYATPKLSADEWRKLEVADNDEDVTYSKRKLWQAIKKVTKDNEETADTQGFKIEHHVAIDRWTGGAADGALYSVLAPAREIGWEDFNLTLDFNRLPDKLQKPALALLLLVLRDLTENRIPLGFATNRGMGEIEVNEIKIAGDALSSIGIAQPLALEVEKTNDRPKLIFTSDVKELNQAWATWIKNPMNDTPQAGKKDDEQAA